MKSIREYAMNYLSRREHSQFELRKKLVYKGCDVQAVDVELQQLGAEGLQSDARFVENYLRAKMAAGYGPRYIAQQFQQRGVDSELFEQALQSVETWEATLLQVWQKKYQGVPNSVQEQAKQQRFLLSRGFEPYHVSQLLKAVH